MRRKTSMMFTNLCPNEFDWIEFRSIYRKAIDMQATAMLIKKRLSLRADVNFMIVPNQNNLTWNQVKQMLQKSNDMHRTKTALTRMNRQPNPLPARDREANLRAGF